jgi:hypothetical protein
VCVCVSLECQLYVQVARSRGVECGCEFGCEFTVVDASYFLSDVIQKWVMYVCQSVSNDCSELVYVAM